MKITRWVICTKQAAVRYVLAGRSYLCLQDACVERDRYYPADSPIHRVTLFVDDVTRASEPKRRKPVSQKGGGPGA
jgi:hypothetical protein